MSVMNGKPNSRILVLSQTTKFSYQQLEEAAIEYGAHFLDIIAEEASRTDVDLLTVVRAATPRRIE